MPFFLYNLAADNLGTTSELAGLGAGFAGGLLVARGVGREKPTPLRAAWVMAAASVIVVMAAAPFRGTIDFTPEIARIAAVEERTADAYDTALANYHVGRIRAKELIQVIEKTILPELQAVHSARRRPARRSAGTGAARRGRPGDTSSCERRPGAVEPRVS